MRLRRKRPQPLGRQKLRGDDLAPTPSAFAYRARRSKEARVVGRQVQADTPRPDQVRTTNIWLQRFGLIILLIAGVASLINVLTLSSAAKIILLNDNSSQALLRPLSVYQRAADQQLADSIWNRNKITVDTGRISQQLLHQFPELSSVSMTVPLLAHRPLVYVEPARPALILIAGNGSFAIGDNGQALLAATNPALVGQTSTLPVVDDQSGLNVQLNRRALSADTVSFIQTVVAQLAAKQFVASTMTLPVGASELDVHLSGQPY
ncbi:MAG TPA: hypothetical protein VIJ68_00390, partial [Candidatus Saccharimonadales bacterium]